MPEQSVYVPVSQDTELQEPDPDLISVSRKRPSLRMAALSAVRTCSLNLCLLVLNVTLFLFLLGFTRNASRQISTLTDYRSLNFIVPEFGNEVRIFQPDHAFWNIDSGNRDSAWEKIGGSEAPGFLSLSGIGTPKEETGVFGVSVLHQLHCLSNIRGVFLNLLHGQVDGDTLSQQYYASNGSDEFQSLDTSSPVLKHTLRHLLHCFDYLRQGIECTADMSLEIPHKGSVAGTVDGWGHAHLCRKWEDIWAWFEENRSLD